MASLLQRAQEIIAQRPHLQLLREEEESREDDPITEEERREITQQINEVVARNRIDADASAFEVHPTKRSGLLVLGVNLVALAVIAAGIYATLLYFDSRREEIVSPEVSLSSAEGRLLETLREETEAQLSEKEEEIAGIQDRLEEIDAERRRLAEESEEIIAEREAEIRASFQAQLEAERERLAGQGLSESDIAERLAAFEEEQAGAIADRVAEVRAEAQAELAEREAAIEELVADFEGRLESAEAERRALDEERDELTARLEAEAATLEAERTEALEELDALRRRQEQSEQVLSQLTSLYAQVDERIEAGRYGAAREGIEAIRSFLNRPNVADLPAVDGRRPVDLFLTDALSQLISFQERESSRDTESLVEIAGLVRQASRLVENADELLASGDVTGAEELYRAALDQVPPARRGFQGLEEIAADSATARREEIAAAVAEGNRLYAAEDYEAAARAYEEAVAYLPSADAELVSRILDTGFQLRAAVVRLEARQAVESVETELTEARSEVAALQRETESLNRRLEERSAELRAARRARAEAEAAAEEAAAVRAAGVDPDIISGYRERVAAGETAATREDGRRRRVLELLETKLLLLRITNSPGIREQYPDLYQQTQRFFEDLVATEREGASVETLQAVNALLDGIVAERSVEELSGPAPAGASAAVRRETLRLLDRLETMLDRE